MEEASMRRSTFIKGWWLFAFVSVPLLGLAADVPHLFKSGDPILSSQVNANFKSLADRITTLEQQGVQDNPWVKVSGSVPKPEWDAVMAKYPLAKYEWGTDYPPLEAGAPGSIHPLTVSAWNGGIRISTGEFLQGDGIGPDDAPDFWLGGVAWFFGTQGSFDDACNGRTPPQLKQFYWKRTGAGITFSSSTGCNTGSWYVRRR
jgi:hypothetical protein